MKTAKQLGAKGAAALANPPRNASRLVSATKTKTIRDIATLTFPNYKGRKISIEVADHVDRHVEGGGTFYVDWLVELSQIKQAGPNHAASRAGGEVVPLSTGVPIQPGTSAQITCRVQSEFRCERFMISGANTPGGAADWIVNNIQIGNRSQFVQSGDLPGDMFAVNAIDAYVSFETARVEMDIVVTVTYVGANVSGVPFYGSMIGTRIESGPPQYTRVQQPDAVSRNGNLRTKITFGFAYVSQHVFMGKDAGVTIYLPPIDQATIDVAVDATLISGKPTPAVVTMIENALEGRGGMLRDAYVALVAQLAGKLSSAEAKARRY